MAPGIIMVNILILDILLLFMVSLSVLEIFGKKEKRFAPVIATLIMATFLSIFLSLASSPTPSISAMLIALLGVVFSLVYFYESYTGSGLIILYEILKGKRDNHG